MSQNTMERKEMENTQKQAYIIDMVNNLSNLNNDKKCKIDSKKLEKCSKNPVFSKTNAKEENERLLKIAYKTDLITYIKVLLEAYKSLPNIMNIIDRLIEKRASSIIPASTIYGSSFFTTYNEINKVIDMSERKDKLLNLYVIIENMLDGLSDRERKIVILKYVQKNNTEDIAKDFDTTDRTIYRTANRIIEKLAIYMLKQNWDSEFIRFQIGTNEPWLNDLFRKKKNEEKVNKQRGERGNTIKKKLQ